jgi:hypothetical protein
MRSSPLSASEPSIAVEPVPTAAQALRPISRISAMATLASAARVERRARLGGAIAALGHG